MARLIVKSPYIKGGGKGGYLKYIGTRDGVELLPSGYMEYMAARPRSHGLFGDEAHVDMDKAITEVNEYPGNIWTHIISLKREDAERLDYDHAEVWRDLLRAHRSDIAKAMHILPGDFRWYAAFHDEGDHPHVHMMAWSVKPGQAYLSKGGIRQIKSALTNDIFRQEMLHTYEQKSTSRDELVRESRRIMWELTHQMREGICGSPEIENQMMVLAAQLETVSGKRQFGYLPKRVKETVNRIVDELEKVPVVDQCFQTWCDLQCQIKDHYSKQERERPPLSAVKDFRAIKNAVIQEAERIRRGEITFENDDLQDELDGEEDTVSRMRWEQVMAYQESKAVLYDEDSRWAEKEDAVRALHQLWEEGLTAAAHQLGKCYRDGLGVIPDDEKAEAWFRASDEMGNDDSQYALGKLLQAQGRISEAVGWYEKTSLQGNPYADYRLGKLYLAGKDMPKDVDRAVEYLTRAAKAGNQYAQYALGKLYLAGEEVPQDRERAYTWFAQAAFRGNEYAEFILSRWDSLKPPSVMLSVTRLLHHMGRIFRDAPLPRSAATAHPHIDRKRIQALREKKMALGHKTDDHEEQQYGGWNMTM